VSGCNGLVSSKGKDEESPGRFKFRDEFNKLKEIEEVVSKERKNKRVSLKHNVEKEIHTNRDSIQEKDNTQKLNRYNFEKYASHIKRGTLLY